MRKYADISPDVHVFQGMRSTDLKFGAGIAELIDNSLDKNAKTISIQLNGERISPRTAFEWAVRSNPPPVPSRRGEGTWGGSGNGFTEADALVTPSAQRHPSTCKAPELRAQSRESSHPRMIHSMKSSYSLAHQQYNILLARVLPNLHNFFEKKLVPATVIAENLQPI
ncbi:MAG: hypothetical protein AB9869_10485 [Verrucomicrobiia bacterium]